MNYTEEYHRRRIHEEDQKKEIEEMEFQAWLNKERNKEDKQPWYRLIIPLG